MHIFGRVIIEVSKRHANYALDLIIKNNINSLNINRSEDECLIIEIYSKNLKQINNLFLEMGIEYQVLKEYGIFTFFRKLKKRFGLLFGAVFLILMVNLSSNLVWKINLVGNEDISKEEILTILNGSGFSLGTYIPNINYDQLHNRVLMQTNKISWISVNFSGNVANVEVKKSLNEEEKKEILYSNVVASADGFISSIEVINGEKMVSQGQIVKKGDLLISGIINSKSMGVRYVNAKGNIKAYTNKDILVKIPLTIEEKIYTGKVITEKNYKIFSKYIKFYLKDSNYDKFYDKIEKKEPLIFFGIQNLPIEKYITEYREYETVKKTRSYKEVVDLAFIELNNQINNALKDMDIVSKTVKTDFDGKHFYVYCNLYCIENIAKEVQFTVNQ